VTDLRVLEVLVAGLDGAGGHVRLAKEVQPVLAGLRGEYLSYAV
jgi:hypothetical protein